MSGQAHLLQLVDLSFGHPEVGAVNFNHLRTLLLGIVKVFPSSGENSDELQQVEKIANESDSGININKQNVRGKDQTEISLPASHKSLEDRVNKLEKDLDSFATFASNNKILGNDDTDGSHTDTEAADTRYLRSLSPSSDNLKTKKRLESAEEAINKLFSLMNEILSKKEPKSIENHLEKDGSGEDKLNQSNAKLEEKETKSGDNKFQNMSGNINNIDEKLKNMKSDIEKNKESLSTHSQEINKNKKQISDNSNRHSEHDRSISDNRSSIEDSMKATKDLQTKISDLEKLIKKLNNLSKTTSTNGDSVVPMKQETSPLDLSSVDCLQDLKNIQQQIDDIVNQLSHKQDKSDLLGELARNLSNHKDSTDEEFSKVKKEIQKLNEAVSNLDNEEVKEMVESMEDLKKMAEQIDDLRKLNDLKDLADNVDSLKDLRSELDFLKESAKDRNQAADAESSKSVELIKEQQESLNGRLENLNEMISSLEKQQQDSREKYGEYENPAQNSEDNGEDIDKRLESNNSVSLKEEVFKLKASHQRLEEMVKDIANNTLKSQGEKDSIFSTSQPPALDTSVLAAIQHLAQQNRHQVAALQAEVNILKKLQKTSPPAPAHVDSDKPQVNSNGDNTMFENLHNHLMTLQEEQVNLAGQLTNMLDDTKDEFNRKQKHVDALYDYIDKLQNNKADKEDINSSMDVKADKQALDNKVNLSTFDERYQMLEQTLQDALQRLDQFMEKENTLTNALDKLHSDLDSKMDSEAEKKLKKFLEDRLKEIQKSRNLLQPQHEQQSNQTDDDVMLQLRNAAGLRKPMTLMYNCISCDRPVDISLRGVMGSIPHNFPAKKSMGPYTSYDLDGLRTSSKKVQQQQHPGYERSNGRQCGGQHTTVSSTTYRTQKNHQYSNEFVDVYEKNVEHQDVSVIDCVVGKDGQIYRGRFRPGQYTQPLKRGSVSNGRAKQIFKQRYVHSATVPSQNKESAINLTSRQDERASSANGVIEAVSQSQNGSPVSTNNNNNINVSLTHEKQRTPSPLFTKSSPAPSAGSVGSRDKRAGSPVVLPPISRDGSLIGDEHVNGLS